MQGIRSIAVGAGLCCVAGTASAFEIGLVAVFGAQVTPTARLVPSSGSFVMQYAQPGLEDAFLNPDGYTVSTSGAVWRNTLDDVMSSTWVALDRYGPRGQDGTAAYGAGWFGETSGPGGTVARPEWNSSAAGPDSGFAVNGRLGDPVDGDGLSPGFFDSLGGSAWYASVETLFRAPSAVSMVNGRMIDSVFIGHFVMSDPGATLAGDPLFVQLFDDDDTRLQFRLPLDGSEPTEIFIGEEIPYRLELERSTFTNPLGTFTAIDAHIVEIPTPPAAALFAVGIAAGARRRR